MRVHCSVLFSTPVHLVFHYRGNFCKLSSSSYHILEYQDLMIFFAVHINLERFWRVDWAVARTIPICPQSTPTVRPGSLRTFRNRIPQESTLPISNGTTPITVGTSPSRWDPDAHLERSQPVVPLCLLSVSLSLARRKDLPRKVS